MTDTLDFSKMEHHPVLEELTDMLVATVGQEDRHFFRTYLIYYFAKMASSMKARIVATSEIDDIPVNVFAVPVANSGFGKGYTMSLIENYIIKSFETRFKQDTFPVISENALWKRAIQNAAMNSDTTEEQEKEKLDKEFFGYGPIPFTFDSGTVAAIKDSRNKLLMGGIGSLNCQIDEFGQNLLSSVPIINIFFELYDQGRAKMRLITNSAEKKRSIEYEGKTPANALMTGTPAAIYDGSTVESAFIDLLETGLARRAIFAWGENIKTDEILTGKEKLLKKKNQKGKSTHTAYSNIFSNLADIAKFEWEMTASDDVMELILDYETRNEHIVATLKESDAIRKHELLHRHNKALKIAGAFAFIDESQDILVSHAEAAIKYVEESGEAFNKFLNREKPYVRLAKHLAECETEQTHADLHEALPFYPTSNRRQELMTFAIAWGNKNNHIIQKSFRDGIEFFSGSSLTETNLDEIILSYSDHPAEGYEPVKVPFHQLHKLTSAQGMHWCSHQFVDEYRKATNAIPEFNLAVFDIDGTAPMDFAKEVLKDHTFIMATTKSHTDEIHRYRLIIPMSHHLKLDLEEYREFMDNFLLWLPFDSDAQAAKDIARKWRTSELSQYYYNDGELVSILPFIPKTSKNEEYQSEIKDLVSLDALERYFAQRIGNGNNNNRNQELFKYAAALVSAGMRFIEIESRVMNFNNQLPNGLSPDELRQTILKTTAIKCTERDAALKAS